MSVDLLRHVLDVCDDPDCEIHRIDVGLDEHTVSDTDLAFFIAGAQVMELAIRRVFDRRARRCPALATFEDQHARLIDACRAAGYGVMRRAFVHAYGCSDCGAPPGRECYPEYGCDRKSRTVA